MYSEFFFASFYFLCNLLSNDYFARAEKDVAWLIKPVIIAVI